MHMMKRTSSQPETEAAGTKRARSVRVEPTSKPAPPVRARPRFPNINTASGHLVAEFLDLRSLLMVQLFVAVLGNWEAYQKRINLEGIKEVFLTHCSFNRVRRIMATGVDLETAWAKIITSVSGTRLIETSISMNNKLLVDYALMRGGKKAIILNTALSFGHLDLVKYAISRKIKLDISDNSIVNAASHGGYEVLQYIESEKPGVMESVLTTPYTCDDFWKFLILRKKDLGLIMKFTATYKVCADPTILLRAAIQTGKVEIARYILDLPIIRTPSTYPRDNRPEDWLHQEPQTPTIEPEHLAAAAMVSMEMVQFFLDKSGQGVTDLMVATAFERGPIDLCEMLLDRKKDFSFEAHCDWILHMCDLYPHCECETKRRDDDVVVKLDLIKARSPDFFEPGNRVLWGRDWATGAVVRAVQSRLVQTVRWFVTHCRATIEENTYLVHQLYYNAFNIPGTLSTQVLTTLSEIPIPPSTTKFCTTVVVFKWLHARNIDMTWVIRSCVARELTNILNHMHRMRYDLSVVPTLAVIHVRKKVMRWAMKVGLTFDPVLMLDLYFADGEWHFHDHVVKERYQEGNHIILKDHSC
jgi:hypothetical protein